MAANINVGNTTGRTRPANRLAAKSVTEIDRERYARLLLGLKGQ